MTTELNKNFCRIMLAQAKLDLTGRELAHFRVNASAIRVRGGRDRWYLFEWGRANIFGETFRMDLQADNAYDAMAQGIKGWLEKVAPTIRARGGFQEDNKS